MSYKPRPSRNTFDAAFAASRAGGVADLAFNNYRHLRPSSLAWIGAALGGSS